MEAKSGIKQATGPSFSGLSQFVNLPVNQDTFKTSCDKTKAAIKVISVLKRKLRCRFSHPTMCLLSLFQKW